MRRATGCLLLQWSQRGREHGSFFSMDDWQAKRLTDTELKEFFDRLFPHGFTGADVLAEIAPEGWEKSPLLACFSSVGRAGVQGAGANSSKHRGSDWHPS
jgi:hypothetical protein